MYPSKRTTRQRRTKHLPRPAVEVPPLSQSPKPSLLLAHVSNSSNERFHNILSLRSSRPNYHYSENEKNGNDSSRLSRVEVDQ